MYSSLYMPWYSYKFETLLIVAKCELATLVKVFLSSREIVTCIVEYCLTLFLMLSV